MSLILPDNSIAWVWTWKQDVGEFVKVSVVLLWEESQLHQLVLRFRWKPECSSECSSQKSLSGVSQFGVPKSDCGGAVFFIPTSRVSGHIHFSGYYYHPIIRLPLFCKMVTSWSKFVMWSNMYGTRLRRLQETIGDFFPCTKEAELEEQKMSRITLNRWK